VKQFFDCKEETYDSFLVIRLHGIVFTNLHDTSG